MDGERSPQNQQQRSTRMRDVTDPIQEEDYLNDQYEEDQTPQN